MLITMKFSRRDRYCRAINYLWRQQEKYCVICRGRDYRYGGWYIGFERLIPYQSEKSEQKPVEKKARNVNEQFSSLERLSGLCERGIIK